MCTHKLRLYKCKNIPNSNNFIKKWWGREREWRGEAGFLACWTLLIENLAKTRTTRKSTFPHESALPKSCLGASQHERKIQNEFPDIRCLVPFLSAPWWCKTLPGGKMWRKKIVSTEPCSLPERSFKNNKLQNRHEKIKFMCFNFETRFFFPQINPVIFE